LLFRYRCGNSLVWSLAAVAYNRRWLVILSTVRSSRGRTTTSAGFGQGPKLGLVGSRHSGRSVYVATRTSDDVIRRRCPIDDYENRRAAPLSAQSGRGYVQRPTLTSITHCGITAHTAVKPTRPTADGWCNALNNVATTRQVCAAPFSSPTPSTRQQTAHGRG